MFAYFVTKEDQNKRLDKLLFKYLNSAPKTLIYKLLRKNIIKLNSKRATGCEIVIAGDVIQFFLSQQTANEMMSDKYVNENLFMPQIVYEDNNILIVNKEAGALSHPESANDTDTLVDRIQSYLYKKGEYDITKTSTFTPGICNRLDRNTSGLVISGKNDESTREISTAIARGNIDRYYMAIVSGRLSGRGMLHGYHLKNSSTNKVKIYQMPVIGAKEVITEYHTIHDYGDFSTIRVKLWTGKSHQIRSHLSGIGHPVIGDYKYGNPKLNKHIEHTMQIKGMMLHAERISFKNMQGRLCYLNSNEFSAPLPHAILKMQDALERMKKHDGL
jgi:23S rRNA pseudouridine955/2504/2580 synthase